MLIRTKYDQFCDDIKDVVKKYENDRRMHTTGRQIIKAVDLLINIDVYSKD